jgi:Rieske [2Fe-2S] domain
MRRAPGTLITMPNGGTPRPRRPRRPGTSGTDPPVGAAETEGAALRRQRTGTDHPGTPEGGELVYVCSLAELAPGEIRAVPGLPVVVCRDGGAFGDTGGGTEGTGGTGGSGDVVVYAFGAACTHAGAALRAGTVVDGCLQCPLHGARFRLSTGAVRRGPARRPLPVYPVVIAVGQVYVDPRPRPRARRWWWPR